MALSTNSSWSKLSLYVSISISSGLSTNKTCAGTALRSSSSADINPVLYLSKSWKIIVSLATNIFLTIPEELALTVT
jgi:hypothetical protein